MSRPDLTLAREFEAALAWWHAAGVDCDYTDDVTALLGALPVEAPPPASQSGPQQGLRPPSGGPFAERRTPEPLATPLALSVMRRDILGESPPPDLASFRQWWMDAPELATPGSFVRVPPRGEAGAALMVLVPQPEEGDRERLLGGPEGRLLTAIIAATGLAESEVYLASALPCHMPLADLAALAAGGMDAVTAHHVGLVRPARVIAFGTGLAPMLGAAKEHDLREFNYIGGKVPLLVSETLDALMNMPRLKARFWRRWMEWSATL
jgi:DNA polymerase